MLCMVITVVVLLQNVKEVYSSIDGTRCEWFCTSTGKSSPTARKMEILLNISKRVDQKCVANNIHNTTTTGYVFVLPVSKEHYFHHGFSLVRFITLAALEQTFQTEEINETVIRNVSCLLQPALNQTVMAVSNGLNVLRSLRFHISFDNQSWNMPFVGYVYLETNYHLSAGFSNGNVSEDHELTLTSFYYVLTLLIRIAYILWSPLVLTLFCPTLKKLRRENHSGKQPEESDYHAKGESPSYQNTKKQPREHDDIGICVEEICVEKICAGSWLMSTEDNSPGPSAVEQGSKDKAAASSQQLTNFAAESEMDGFCVDVIDVGEPASPIGIRSSIANCIFLHKAKPTGKKWKRICYPIVEIFILIMSHVGVLLCTDVFVLGVPRLFSQAFTNLSPPYLIESVFSFAFKKLPGLCACAFCLGVRMLCVIFKPSSSTMVPSFIHRKHITCFLKTCEVIQALSPSNYWHACDECNEIDPSDSSKDSSIPDNIQQNSQSFGFETLDRNWKDASEILVVNLSSGNWEGEPEILEGSSLSRNWRDVCRNLVSFVGKVLLSLLKLALFIILTVVDCIVSLPIVSFCLGGCWYTFDWLRFWGSRIEWFKNKLVKAVFFFFEFVFFCLSIVWVIYFSYCCSLSLQIASNILLITGMKFPIETLSSVAINVLICHSIWTLYCSYTNTYFHLLRVLFDVCKKHHRDEMKEYTKGYKQYIPKDLFDIACDKLEPVRKHLKKLGKRLSLYIIFLCLLFSIVFGTNFPLKFVLPRTVGFLIISHPIVWDFFVKRGEEKELKNSSKESEVEILVKAYFEGKID